MAGNAGIPGCRVEYPDHRDKAAADGVVGNQVELN